MATVKELIDEIKTGCPELSESIDNLKGNLHHKTLTKMIKKKKPKKTLKKQKEPKKKYVKPIKTLMKPSSSSTSPEPQKPELEPPKLPEPVPSKSSSAGDVNFLLKTPSAPDDAPIGKPFTSELDDSCDATKFTKKYADLITKTQHKNGSTKHFGKIKTNPDGNCGYHGMIQGLLESYFLMGSKSHDNLKKFVEEVKQKLNVNVKEIIVKNRNAEFIDIPREVINYFRNFILEIKGNTVTQSGEKAHIFEREDEVASMKYDNDNEKFTKKPIKKKQITQNKLNNKQLIDKIKGGNLQSNSIPSKYWLNEKVIVGCQAIFKVPFYCFMTYTDTKIGVNKAIWNPCDGDVFDCGHIIFIENNGNHFTLMTTDLQDYNNNILKCIGAETKTKKKTESDTKSDTSSSDDTLSSSSSDSDSSKKKKPKPKSKSKSKSNTEDKIKQLMETLNVSKMDALKALKQASGNVGIAAELLLQSKSDKSSDSSNDESSDESSDSSMTLNSMSETELDKNINYKENKKLYKKELYRIISKKYAGQPESVIQKELKQKISALEIQLKKEEEE